MTRIPLTFFLFIVLKNKNVRLILQLYAYNSTLEILKYNFSNVGKLQWFLSSKCPPHLPTLSTSRQIHKRMTILCLHKYPLSIKNANTSLSIVSLCSEYNTDHKVMTVTS